MNLPKFNYYKLNSLKIIFVNSINSSLLYKKNCIYKIYNKKSYIYYDTFLDDFICIATSGLKKNLILNIQDNININNKIISFFKNFNFDFVFYQQYLLLYKQ